MKHKVSKQILSTLLALVMVIGLIPASTLTAFAAGPTEIEELSLSFRSPNETPAVGEPIKYMSGGRLDENDDRVELTGNILLWCIDDSSQIINQTSEDTGMYYEAGRTYNAEIVVEVLDPEQYTIGENTKITLTNPGDFTYTSELSSIVETGNSFFANMKLTITMNGERTYPDITKVVFKDLNSPTDGMSVTKSITDIHYSNCTMTSGIWLGNVWGKDEFEINTFVAGETYTYRVVLTARDGYKFDENATVQFTSGGVAKSPSYYAYTDENRVLTLDYTYTIPSITWVDCVEATIKRFEQNLTPIAGERAIDLFKDTLEVDEYAPYEVIGELGRTWYSENGTKLSSNDQFEAGKTYYFNYSYSIKNEYTHLYRFSPDNLTTTITGESYTGKGFLKAERVEYSNHDNTYVTFRYYFTAQFPEGAGSSANNPAVCHSYAEFEYAMESNDIRYVALGNVDDMLPYIPHDPEVPDNREIAIVVHGKKDLNLLGDATFTCPIVVNYDYKTYEELITLADYADSDLYIHGTGSLTFEGSNLIFYNSAIRVQGGSLTVDGATVAGSNGNHSGYCYGINAIYGSVSIQGGATIRGGVYEGHGVYALSVGGEGITRSLSVSIWDGNFYVDRVKEGGYTSGGQYIPYVDYGIGVENDCGLRIYGGSIEGIHLGRYAADTLDDYVMSGRVMTVNGVKTAPANCGTTEDTVEVYREIPAVNVHVNSPAAGDDIPFYVENVYTVPEGARVQRITWYENGDTPSTSQFIAGNSYKVEIALAAEEGARFADPLTSAKINYKTATVTPQASGAQYGIILTVDFGACPATVPQVDLTVTAPKEGNKPSYSVVCGNSAYYAVGGSSNYTDYRKWYMSSDNDEWWEIGSNHTFMSGYYYKLVVDIRTSNGYEFPLIDNGTIQPNVSATVNGYYASVIKAYDQDPSTYITVEYNFGECNDSVVENITVENVIAPVAGEKPNYSYSIRGNGYQMDTAKNAYYDAYWKNPPEKWYYIKNGISWWDVTDGAYDYVYENDTFIPGHQYQCKVYLKVEDGFEFAYNNGTPTVTATMNGNGAEIKTSGSGLQWEQQVTYTFTCSQAVLSAVEVSGIDAPVAGQSPDYTGTVGNAVLYGFANYGYNAAGFWWYDSEDNPLTSEDKFVAGETYRLEIKLTCATIESVVASRFQTPVAATLNGKTVDSSDVMANSTTVYIYQTYTCKEASAVFVSGSVTSFNDASGDITLQLIPEGFSEPAYETIVKGNTVDYYFADVAAGTYTLKVMKENHVTREYTVVVGNSSVIQDVKIHLKGDINGDGKVTTIDFVRVNSHARGVTLLSGYELKCADVVGTDGKVTTADAIRINAHAKGTSLLW